MTEAMRVISAPTFLLGLLWPLLGSCTECPTISDWRNATMTPGGSLVCAKLYGNANCSGFPMLLGVNSPISNLRHTLEQLGIGKGDNVTVLIRPLCHMTFLSGSNINAREHTSSGYLWSRSIDGVFDATCACDTNNVEMLSCGPKEHLEPIQECNYLDSSVGGICPYAIDARHFKWNDERDDDWVSSPFTVYLPPDETEAANLLIGSRVASTFKIPLRKLGDADTTKYVMYAPVKPHQALRISQLQITCGSYTLRTTEVKFDYEIAQPNTWVLNQAAGRLYYFSRETERETRENAASRCEDLGGRLATLDRPEDADFAARIVAKNFNNGTTSWWTAATTNNHGEKCWLRWERGGLVDNLHFGQCREDAPCVLMKLFWRSDPLDRFSLIECENQLPFVCEKFPEL